MGKLNYTTEEINEKLGVEPVISQKDVSPFIDRVPTATLGKMPITAEPGRVYQARKHTPFTIYIKVPPKLFRHGDVDLRDYFDEKTLSYFSEVHVNLRGGFEVNGASENDFITIENYVIKILSGFSVSDIYDGINLEFKCPKDSYFIMKSKKNPKSLVFLNRGAAVIPNDLDWTYARDYVISRDKFTSYFSNYQSQIYRKHRERSFIQQGIQYVKWDYHWSWVRNYNKHGRLEATINTLLSQRNIFVRVRPTKHHKWKYFKLSYSLIREVFSHPENRVKKIRKPLNTLAIQRSV